MRRGNPHTPLVILVVTVPIVVGGTGLASFLLLRTGYGLVVGGLLPFLAMLLLVGCLGVVLGRIVGRTLTGDGRRGVPEEKPRGGTSLEDRADDV